MGWVSTRRARARGRRPARDWARGAGAASGTAVAAPASIALSGRAPVCCGGQPSGTCEVWFKRWGVTGSCGWRVLAEAGMAVAGSRHVGGGVGGGEGSESWGGETEGGGAAADGAAVSGGTASGSAVAAAVGRKGGAVAAGATAVQVGSASARLESESTPGSDPVSDPSPPRLESEPEPDSDPVSDPSPPRLESASEPDSNPPSPCSWSSRCVSRFSRLAASWAAATLATSGNLACT